jgi:chromosome segregation ATPase
MSNFNAKIEDLMGTIETLRCELDNAEKSANRAEDKANEAASCIYDAQHEISDATSSLADLETAINLLADSEAPSIDVSALNTKLEMILDIEMLRFKERVRISIKDALLTAFNVDNL